MNRKIFRRKILSLHYELSEGNSLKLVLRQHIADKLGETQPNNPELLAAIKYLEDKGFLKSATNMEDSITANGIDEVENNFPSFNEDSDNLDVDHVLRSLLVEITQLLDLEKQGLLKQGELRALESKIKELLYEILKKDTITWRKYDKLNRRTTWLTQTYDGYVRPNEAERILAPWLIIINEVLDERESKPLRKEYFIAKGQYFDGRKILRDILKRAQFSIDIQDNYLNLEILNILQEYKKGNTELNIRILTQKISHSFKSDLDLFIKQYGKITVKEHANCHDRFIIIDGGRVFSSGHSLKDLGDKASVITELTDEETKNKIISDFNSWTNVSE